MTDWHYATLLEAAEAIRSRRISPVELTDALLDRIARLEPTLHSYATVTSGLASEQALRAEREIAAGKYRGPLHGIPVAVKDLCDTAGIVTAAGMPIRDGHVPDTDATVVARLADAGAILLGKLQLTEGAFADHHPTITPPRNPWHADYYAGASSSGSGVATAAGLCFGSLGTDTGGSIRFPCAATGVTGIKPTWGRVSRYGVFPLAPSLDHVGPMTRSAADAGAMLGAIAGVDPHDATTLAAPVPNYLADLDRGVRELRIGVDASYNETGCDDDVIAAVREASKMLKDLGASIVDVKVPDPAAVTAAWSTCCSIECAIAHESTYPARAAEYGRLSELIESGRAVGALELMKAHHARLEFSGALAALFSGIDLLLVPTQPRADFTLADEKEVFGSAEGFASFLRFVTPFDMAGTPTITLPGGFTRKGLPVSFQLVGRHLDEALLVRAGAAYQRVTDWHQRHPAL
jgi:amidase